ncbi:diguanylate cyclase [Castellaniella sp.]|uniref:diguanylate cyclase n=1 Tax=Castellaniella sp. TaxID=1955812 RepID=UPI002AFFD8C2|nr:diguanylate cyclase [Castellaniella sp.]
MNRTLPVVVLLLLIGLGTTLGLESWDRSRHDAAVTDRVQQQLNWHARRLSDDLQALLALNRRLADALAAVAPGQEAGPFAALAPQMVRQHADIRSVVYVDRLKITQVYPVAGNENVIGLDYGLHPEFMAKIKQMIQQQTPVIDGTARLVQTGRTGLIVRTPLFVDAAPGQPPIYRGMAALTVDLARTLRQAGLQGADLPFDLAIRSAATADHPARVLDGEPGLFDQPHAQARIALPDGDWELAAVPRADLVYDGARAWLIRGIGGGFTMMVLLLFLYRRGVLTVGLQGRKPEAGLMSLRTLLLLATLVPLSLIVGLAGWLVFTVSIQTVQSMEQQRVEELAAQLRDKVSAFFEEPRAAATFNIRQLQDGLLSLDARSALLHSFLLQLRQQPLLTYLSFSTASGDYLAASRPPRGPEQGLQILEASQADGGIMNIYRVDDANRRSTQLPAGNAHFDPRVRPWFTAAVDAGALHWYMAYQYAIQAVDGHYDDMGMGMAAPLYDARHQLLGVLTADVALTRISQFLSAEMDGLGGVAFLMEPDGRLLARSDGGPVYEQHDGQAQQILAVDSASSVIQRVSAEVRQSGRAFGHRLLAEQSHRYQTHWQSIQLPDGPLLTLALALPESRYAGPVEQSIQRIGLLILGFWMLGLMAVSLSAWWLSRPLQALIRWAGSLADGQWQAPPAVRSPVQEIVMLARALGSMAERLQGNQQALEQQVADRTQALVLANQQLMELSVTDSLTGLANRRHFDEVLEQEWHRARREGRAVSLLMIDVDWFKHYNDAYGHQAGDAVLQHVGRVLRQIFQRSGDLSARYGGEEFAVIMVGLDGAAGALMAQRVCDAISALDLPHEYGLNGRVTVSVGVAEMDLENVQAVQKLIGQADSALYRAKAAGRNCIECSTESDAPSAQDADKDSG